MEWRKRFAEGIWTLAVAAFLTALPFVGRAEPLLQTPVYDDVTKSYYELVDYRPTTGGYGLRWNEAQEYAQRHTLGGVKGHLAVIRDPQTELFLKVNLRPTGATWFGLYYDCDSGKFMWIDGKQLGDRSYSNFDRNYWLRDRVKLCDKIYPPKYPAFLDMRNDRRWAIKGPIKLFYFFIIQYPTNGRVSDAKSIQTVTVPEATESNAASVGNVTPDQVTSGPIVRGMQEKSHDE